MRFPTGFGVGHMRDTKTKGKFGCNLDVMDMLYSLLRYKFTMSVCLSQEFGYGEPQ